MNIEEISENKVVEEISENKVVEEISENKVVDEISENKVVEEISENKVVEEISENKVVEEISENKVVEEISEDKVVDEISENKVEEPNLTENEHSKGSWHALSNYEEALVAIREYETRTVTKFSVFITDKDFGQTDLNSKKHKIMWHGDWYPFNGTPIIMASRRVLDCQNGKDRKQDFKEKRKLENSAKKQKVDAFYETNLSLRKTKKFGCPAQIKLKEVALFPDFKINADTSWKKTDASKRLRKAISNKTAVSVQKIFIFLPEILSHKNHVTGEDAGSLQGIDSRLISEIRENTGIIRNVAEMQRFLNRIVTKEWFHPFELPPKTNKRFFPRARTIRSHMLESLKSLKHSQPDIDCLLDKTPRRKKKNPEDHFFVNPKRSSEVAEPVHEINDESVNVTDNNTTGNQNQPNQHKMHLKASMFREQLKRMNGLSFICEDVFDEAMPLVEQLVCILEKSVPEENGLKLEKVQRSSTLKRKHFSGTLPSRKKPDKSNNRHVQGAPVVETAGNIEIEPESEENVIQTEIVCAIMNINSGSETEESENENPTQNFTISQNEIDDIKGYKMLSDIIINMSQNILKKQFRAVSGLQDTLLGRKYMFKEENKKFTQILHNGEMHWIVISNYNCRENEINLFDSNFHGQINDHVKMQISNLVKPTGDSIKVNVRPCQQQSNSVDCGLFAIANILMVLSGVCPENIKLDEKGLRQHLLESFKNQRFNFFPEATEEDPEYNSLKVFT